MGLHDARVVDAVHAVGRVHPEAASGFLHDDGKDESLVDKRSFTNVLNSIFDVVVFFVPVRRLLVPHPRSERSLIRTSCFPQSQALCMRSAS